MTSFRNSRLPTSNRGRTTILFMPLLGLALTHFSLRNGNKVLRYSAECQQCHHFAKRPDQ